jgi:hypothetical protein
MHFVSHRSDDRLTRNQQKYRFLLPFGLRLKKPRLSERFIFDNKGFQKLFIFRANFQICLTVVSLDFAVLST